MLNFGVVLIVSLCHYLNTIQCGLFCSKDVITFTKGYWQHVVLHKTLFYLLQQVEKCGVTLKEAETEDKDVPSIAFSGRDTLPKSPWINCKRKNFEMGLNGEMLSSIVLELVAKHESGKAMINERFVPRIPVSIQMGLTSTQ